MRNEIEKIVYGKRNKYAILSRKLEYKLFSFLRKIHSPKRVEDQNDYIVVYPKFSDKTKMNDALNRTIWSFPPNSSLKIFYASDIDLELQNIPFQHSYLKDNCDKSQNSLVKISSNELTRLCKDAKAILVWDKKYRYKMLRCFGGSRVRIIDPWYYSLEECNTMKFGLYNILPENKHEEFREQSLRNYRRFRQKNEGKDNSYIFLTGPSFSSYKELNYKENSLKIVCNTIVKDDEFLEFIGGPDIICFCDPAFHFSTNEYANTFRNLVWKCVNKYGSYIAIPQSCVPLITYNFPEVRDKIIGLRKADIMTIPTDDNLAVKPTGSVITFMMLPLAVSLTKNVGIIGADGRGKQENYFWKHNEKVQLTELMECVYETHPSFFRDRSYADHYDHHCEEVKKMVELGESFGAVIKARTPSFVPCLNERYDKE